MKVYSIYDQEVGYCQGLGFIGGVLLMHVKFHSFLYFFSFFSFF